MRSSLLSPAAIIRNAKIWNIILLLAFFRTLSSNLDLEYPAVSEENCLKNLLPLPCPQILGNFDIFRLSEKRGELKRCNSHVTAYKSVLKFLQVSVKSITYFKIVIALYMPVLFFKHCHLVDSIDAISVDTYPTGPIRSV